jgi:chaperonin GroEL
MEKIGKDGIVQVEESQTFGITTEYTDGLEFDKGYVSPYMVTNQERMEAEYKNAPIYITDKKINTYKEIFPLIDQLAKQKATSLIIIADDFSDDTIRNFIIMKLQGAFNVLAIKAPGYGDNKKIMLEDLAVMVGAEISIDGEFKVGSAEKVISTKDSTTIIKGKGNIKEHLENLKNLKDITDNKMEKDRLEERIAKLSNSIAVIKVGTASDTTLSYLKQKVEDGVNEAKRALEDGICVGGNTIFLHAIRELKIKKGIEEYNLGYNLVLESVTAPLAQIILNSKGKPDVMMTIIGNNPSGYNAKTNEVIDDMYASGIIDAVKVPITILENAVEEVSTFLTIGASINDDQDEKLQSK